jgi:DNA-binding IscR family transcriptional regulator
MQVSAKVDHGLRAMLELASRSQGDTVDLVGIRPAGILEVREGTAW